MKHNLLTGATGLLGSHIAEHLVARGERVRALVRPTSDTTFLRRLGVELVVGDLADRVSLCRAVDGADTVYHCASHVGNWGPWSTFQRQVIDATANLLDACRSAGVGRVLHVSSIIAYGHPRIGKEPIAEDAPLGQRLRLWDYYCRAKVQAELLCRQYPGPWTIVRPSWIYGPRDRTTLPRLLEALDAGRIGLVGDGGNLINMIHAADVADGAIRAANHPRAAGQAYNLSSPGELTQKELLDLLTDGLNRPRVVRRVSLPVAYGLGLFAEVVARLIFLRRPPHLSRYGVGLLTRSTRFSIDKARTELGWSPRVGMREGMAAVLSWWHGRQQASDRKRLAS